MANPDPEIWPPDAMEARPDAIIATGRSDFPNQVNNVLGFPFIFRGALDVRATAINDEMKIAAAEALAELAREPVPEEVAAAYGGRSQSFGRDYIIPAPFDPRLMEVVASAVAEAAMKSGVAQKEIVNFDSYRQELRARLNPTVSALSLAYESAKAQPKRVLFAEGEEPNVLRAAIAFREAGYGTPVLVGREDVYNMLREMGVDDPKSYEVLNSRNSPLVGRAVDYI
jgi:malate dehydrogenase (oxaloacetate-decarboxylating)(NADP+)